MGESVAAFVQPAPGAVRGPELEQEIIAFVKSKIASFKAPRTVRFVDELPRSEAGKLMKSELRATWESGELGPRPAPHPQIRAVPSLP
jgi:long-chain acyl-CoA synthetase